MFLRFAYTVFIGVLLATFVGVGIAAFYPGPKPPEYPVSLKFTPPERDSTPSAQYIQDQEAQDQKYKEFEEQNKQYSRNVSMMSLGFALLILALSLTILKSMTVFSDSFLLGGVLLLLYSIVRGFGAEDNIYRFAVTGVGLVVALGLGYLKMVKYQKSA